MRSIKWKLIAMYLGLVFIVMIVSGTYILVSLRNSETEKAKAQLEQYVQKIEEQVVLSYDETDFSDGFKMFLTTNVSDDSQIECNILNSQGVTIASTAYRTPQYRYSVIIGAISGTPGFLSNKKTVDAYGAERRYMAYAYPVTINGEVKYVIYAQMDATGINNSLAEIRRIIILAAVISLVLAIIMGYFFSKTITDPILKLSGKAKELAGGQLKQEIKVITNDEIGELSSSFNYMAKQLDKNMNEISGEKNKLEVILHNMSDGVISFDKYGNITHANTTSCEMLEMDNLEYTFTEFIKAFDINAGAYLDLSSERTKQFTFDVNKKFISATFSPYSYSVRGDVEGIVAVLRDITEEKKLDDMRKEFVANVSHELRTPLTTVKSYTETLMDGALKQEDIAMEFLGIINSEADRMAFLVRDLLQLSHFDNNKVVLNKSVIDINALVEENIRQSKIHADNKQQLLYFEPFDKEAFIEADKDRITQVLNNILTNAIKYSLNQAKIKVYIEEDRDFYKINVKDSGFGIPRENISRIFERFYRVDKARSRAMGGTGLGLAIAKEIMELHEGKITVQSEYGKGTTMTLWFSKNILD